MKYRQCVMARGSITVVEWLPVEYAVVSKVLKLLIRDRWVDGWLVVWTGEARERPTDWRAKVRDHRENTGDSLSKDEK